HRSQEREPDAAVLVQQRPPRRGELGFPPRELGPRQHPVILVPAGDGPQHRPAVDSAAMTDLDEHGRPEPPIAAGEADSIPGYLDYQRATFAWKTQGLDAAGLRATVGVSTMTLGGMIKHLALVEDDWLSYTLLERERQPLWIGPDWDADRDWDWHSAVDDSPE